ncbi:MAG: ATP cone domain-containing protein, partial [Lactobacillus crispatus]|nr:ATP cone domain-containing protein [Lactobacillus crispatus]
MLKETPSKKMIVEAMKKPQYLVKRDSTKTNFETYKLDLVIHNLKLEDHEVEILKAIFSDLAMKDTVSAAEVAESFVDNLTKLGFVDEAKAYIEYRKKDDADWKKQIDTKARLKRMIEGDPSIVNENANKDSEIFSTQRDLTAGTVGKTVGLTMMPEHIAKAHLRGDIHWHDLDYTPLSPMTNCCLIDFK